MVTQLKMSKSRELFAVISLIFVGYIVMHDMAFVPIYNNLYMEFGDKPMFLVNLLISGGMLASTIAQIFTPALLKKFSKKALLSAGGVLYAVTAIASGLKIEIVFMNVMLLLCGLTQGVCTVCGAGLITDIYCENEEKKGKVMGIYQALMNVFSVIMSYIAGVMAVNGWTNIFKLYWLAIPVALLFIFGIPSGIKPAELVIGESAEAAGAAEAQSGTQHSLGKKFWLNVMSMFCTFTMQIPAVLLVSIYIFQFNLGDEAFAGTVSSVGTAFSFILTLLMGFIIKKFGKATLSLATTLMIVGSAIMVFAPSVAGCMVGSALCAGGYGLTFAYGYILLPESAPVEKTDIAIVFAGVISVIVQFLGINFLSPVIESVGATTAILACMAIGVVSLVIQAIGRKVK